MGPSMFVFHVPLKFNIGADRMTTQAPYHTSRNALMSVYRKEGIDTFAKDLQALGFNIYSSGNTHKHLIAHGVTSVDIATMVGDPILNHRVVTLSREIHAGLLARPVEEDLAELERISAVYFDVVVVDLYPFMKVWEDNRDNPAKVLEMVDIGGPTLLRSGAKGGRYVLCREDQRDKLLAWLRFANAKDPRFPELDQAVRNKLAEEVESYIGEYTTNVAHWYSTLTRSYRTNGDTWRGLPQEVRDFFVSGPAIRS